MKKKRRQRRPGETVDAYERWMRADTAVADALRDVSIDLEREIDIATIRHDADMIPGLRLALEIVDR